MTKRERNLKSSTTRLEKSNFSTNRPPKMRAIQARRRFIASDKDHEKLKVELARECLGITFQYLDDRNAYQKFCEHPFFQRLMCKPGKKIDFNDIPNVVCQFIFCADNRRRKQVAYKLSRIVDCCQKEGVITDEFDNFISERKSLNGAYKYAVENHSRAIEKNTIGGSDSVDSVISNNSNIPVAEDDQPKGESIKSPPTENLNQPNRRKPNHPKSEKTINLQATEECTYSAVLGIDEHQEIDVRLKRRPYDGEYVDLAIVMVLSETRHLEDKIKID